MILYHGSTSIIEQPTFGASNPHNDYGQGFYCTESLELAKEWACQKGIDGHANKYELDVDKLKVLNLSEEKYSILHWLSILMQNRTFNPKSPLGKQNLNFLAERYKLNYLDYDVIIGYRANDSYFSFASDFLENIIPIQSLASAMKLGSLGLQVVLKSEKAFSEIRFIGAEGAPKSTYFTHYKERDTAARKKYFDELKSVKQEEAIYLLDIIRKPEILNGIKL